MGVAKANEVAAREFNRLFREYTISFAAFKKLGFVFVAAIILLVGTVVWQTPLTVGPRVAFLLLLAGIIFLVGLYLQRSIAPTPAQLASIDFLQNNFVEPSPFFAV